MKDRVGVKVHICQLAGVGYLVDAGRGICGRFEIALIFAVRDRRRAVDDAVRAVALRLHADAVKPAVIAGRELVLLRIERDALFFKEDGVDVDRICDRAVVAYGLGPLVALFDGLLVRVDGDRARQRGAVVAVALDGQRGDGILLYVRRLLGGDGEDQFLHGEPVVVELLFKHDFERVLAEVGELVDDILFVDIAPRRSRVDKSVARRADGDVIDARLLDLEARDRDRSGRRARRGGGVIAVFLFACALGQLDVVAGRAGDGPPTYARADRTDLGDGERRAVDQRICLAVLAVRIDAVGGGDRHHGDVVSARSAVLFGVESVRSALDAVDVLDQLVIDGIPYAQTVRDGVLDRVPAQHSGVVGGLAGGGEPLFEQIGNAARLADGTVLGDRCDRDGVGAGLGDLELVEAVVRRPFVRIAFADDGDDITCGAVHPVPAEIVAAHGDVDGCGERVRASRHDGERPEDEQNDQSCDQNSVLHNLFLYDVAQCVCTVINIITKSARNIKCYGVIICKAQNLSRFLRRAPSQNAKDAACAAPEIAHIYPSPFRGIEKLIFLTWFSERTCRRLPDRAYNRWSCRTDLPGRSTPDSWAL